VEVGLNVLGNERDARRAAIDHTTDGDAVALAPGRDPKEMTDAVVRHGAATDFQKVCTGLLMPWRHSLAEACEARQLGTKRCPHSHLRDGCLPALTASAIVFVSFLPLVRPNSAGVIVRSPACFYCRVACRARAGAHSIFAADVQKRYRI